MKTTHPILAALAVLICVIPAAAQWSEQLRRGRESLKGLPLVVVRADLSSMDAFPEDPTERELQEFVEMRLKTAGINVIKRDRYIEHEDPTLVVSVGFRNHDIYYHDLDVSLALRQKVSLASNPRLQLTTPTWEWRGASMGTPPKRDQIAEFIDIFICDFRKANPEIKGPLPDCDRSYVLRPPDFDAPKKLPTVMTKLEDHIIRAAALDQVDDVRSLIAKGADVNSHDPMDATPLSYAVRSGSRKPGHVPVIQLLLQHGADPNVSVSCRLTPLMYAVQRGDMKVVELLLDHKADVNATTHEGYTALMAASILGSPEIVSLLLRKGANVNATTRDGQTALTLATANRNRIAAYDRSSPDRPYDSIPEAVLLKQAQTKHDQVIELLQSAARGVGR